MGRPLLSTVALLLLLSAPAFSFSTTDSLQSDFAELKTLRLKVLHKGADEKDMAQFRQLRDAFVRLGDLAAEFLIGKVREMNSEEAAYEKDLNDIDGAGKYMIDLVRQDKDGLAKYDVCFILADIFPNVTTANQSSILRVLQESYMPSNYGRDDMQFLHYAMLRTGKKAVPTLLSLAADHPADLVRCGVSAVLDSIVEDVRKESPQLKPPAALNCKARMPDRTRAVAGWQAWWAEHERQVNFPSMPDIYDLPRQKPPR